MYGQPQPQYQQGPMTNGQMVPQPYPQAGYQQPYQQPIMMAQPVQSENYPSRAVGKSPQQIKCASCLKVGLTQTETKSGAGTWAVGCVLLLFGCIPCCIIPCCMDDCKDVQHVCAMCGADAGKKRFPCD